MPLRAAARLLGALQFSTVRLQRAWPQTLMQPLALLANMIAGALERKQQHEYPSRPQDSQNSTRTGFSKITSKAYGASILISRFRWICPSTSRSS